MKARPKKPGARSSTAKKPAAGKRAAVARKAKATAKPARSAAARSSKAAKPATAKSAVSKHAPTALGAECTIEHAPDLQKQLAKVLADRASVTLDFSAVKRCDTAGLQVLAAFIRERREAGREVAFASMSEHFVSIVKLLGLTALFTPAEAGA